MQDGGSDVGSEGNAYSIADGSSIDSSYVIKPGCWYGRGGRTTLTLGWEMTASSTSNGLTISPPRLIT